MQVYTIILLISREKMRLPPIIRMNFNTLQSAKLKEKDTKMGQSVGEGYPIPIIQTNKNKLL